MNTTSANKLPDESLDKVNGGFIFNASGISGADPRKHWEVINSETGETVARCETEDEAKEKARKRKINRFRIEWDDLCDLRDQGNG